MGVLKAKNKRLKDHKGKMLLNTMALALWVGRETEEGKKEKSGYSSIVSLQLVRKIK